jgi:hypothetical protein
LSSFIEKKDKGSISPNFFAKQKVAGPRRLAKNHHSISPIFSAAKFVPNVS